MRYRRGDDPDFDRMTDDVVRVRAAWPSACVVAHRHPDTGKVTFHLHVRQAERATLRALLGEVRLHPMRAPSGETTYRFQGSRRHMHALLTGLGVR